ncbi:MAG: hypothetical protein LUO93_01970 [Methanomicrobiales archaeon]|nr:hypothetical protein [Methanomicrobiales archaeon]
MNTIGFTLCAAYAACLARELLGFFYNTDAFEPGLVREHLDDPLERPFVELLVPAVSPVFAISDVRKVPHGGFTEQMIRMDKWQGVLPLRIGDCEWGNWK